MDSDDKNSSAEIDAANILCFMRCSQLNKEEAAKLKQAVEIGRFKRNSLRESSKYNASENVKQPSSKPQTKHTSNWSLTPLTWPQTSNWSLTPLKLPISKFKSEESSLEVVEIDKAYDDSEECSKARRRKRGKRESSSKIHRIERPRPDKKEVADEVEGWSPPELPPGERLRSMTEECSLPYKKQLTSSDLRADQNRLMFKAEFARQNFVPMLKPEESLKEGVPVKVNDLDGKEYSMTLKFWPPKAHVLNGEWCKFAQDHGYKEIVKDCVVTWLFRHKQTRDLCFAITSKAHLDQFTANPERGNASQPEAHLVPMHTFHSNPMQEPWCFHLLPAPFQEATLKLLHVEPLKTPPTSR